jgi:hypothetical protein
MKAKQNIFFVPPHFPNVIASHVNQYEILYI